jgi:hypothetical protein
MYLSSEKITRSAWRRDTLGVDVLREPELFDYLKEFHFSDLSKSEDEFDSFDCVSMEHKMFIELKSRKTHYDDLLIEEHKYSSLIMAAGIRSLTPWYINSTPQGIWGFNLTKLPMPKWEDKWLPITTEFANKKSRSKPVGYFNIKDGEGF